MSEILPVGTKLYACCINGRTMKHSYREREVSGIQYATWERNNGLISRRSHDVLHPEDIGQFWFRTPEEARAAAVQQAQKELDDVVAFIESLPLPESETSVRAEAARHGNVVSQITSSAPSSPPEPAPAAPLEAAPLPSV